MKTYKLINSETTFLPVGTVLYERRGSELSPVDHVLIEKERERKPVPCKTADGLFQLIPLAHLKEI